MTRAGGASRLETWCEERCGSRGHQGEHRTPIPPQVRGLLGGEAGGVTRASREGLGGRAEGDVSAELSSGEVNLVHRMGQDHVKPQLFSFEMGFDTRPHKRGPANRCCFLYQVPICFLLSCYHSLE